MAEKTRGYIIPIGGRESKLANPRVLERFVQLSGGINGYIAVIPTASELPDTGENYVNLFKNLGVKDAYSLEIDKRSDAAREDYLAHLNKATGIFMTGGNQLLLSTTLGGTPVAQLIRRKNAAGTHVAGTSAGAAFIPEHMIAGGQPGLMPRGNMVVLAPGLDSVIEAVGSGILTIIDMSHLSYSSVHKAGPNEPISLVGIRMHTLIEGWRYDALNHIVLPH
ncbi:MAG: cyanophycinase [Burkholderiales bacterium]|nr:cyanophycinase [Burkholderiales bacterium]